MRIAFVLGEFPSLSETFVLNQITGLIDRAVASDRAAGAANGTPSDSDE